MSLFTRHVAIGVCTASAMLAGLAGWSSAAVVSMSSPYLSAANSTLDTLSPTYYLEDFEDGLLNIPGVSFTAIAGSGMAGGPLSVDADDGVIDGLGIGRHFNAVTSAGQSNTTFFFSQVGGQWPRQVAIAVTAGNAVSLGFNAYNPSLNPSGSLSLNVNAYSTSADDFLVTFTDNAGIAAIAMLSNSASTFIHYDHLQFDTAAVPEPSVVGVIALTASMAMARRRSRPAARQRRQ